MDNKPSSPVFSFCLEILSTHQLQWLSLPNTPWNFSYPVVVSNNFLLAVGGRHSLDATIQSSEVHAGSTGLWQLITNNYSSSYQLMVYYSSCCA